MESYSFDSSDLDSNTEMSNLSMLTHQYSANKFKLTTAKKRQPILTPHKLKGDEESEIGSMYRKSIEIMSKSKGKEEMGQEIKRSEPKKIDKEILDEMVKSK